MKKIAILLSVALLICMVFTGCRSSQPQDTTGSTVPSITQTQPSGTTQTQPSGTTQPAGNQAGSRQILENIWTKYADDERFAVYGGTVDNSVSDGPGDLDMTNVEELTTAYLLPREQVEAMEEGASMVHMMNNNIFTSAVFKLTATADEKSLVEAWRDNIQQNRWICGQPDRLLMVKVDDSHILMAFGSNEAMTTFQGKVSAIYADAQTLYDGAVVV